MTTTTYPYQLYAFDCAMKLIQAQDHRHRILLRCRELQGTLIFVYLIIFLYNSLIFLAFHPFWMQLAHCVAQHRNRVQTVAEKACRVPSLLHLTQWKHSNATQIKNERSKRKLDQQNGHTSANDVRFFRLCPKFN